MRRCGLSCLLALFSASLLAHALPSALQPEQHQDIEFDCPEAQASLKKSLSCGPCGSDKPVIIIGAGVSGLAAAFHLKKAGCSNVIVLEAKDHIGGRMATFKQKYKNPTTGKSSQYVLHRGANWIHGKNNPVWDMNQKLDLFPTQWLPRSYISYPTFGSSPVWYKGNATSVPGDDVREKFEEYVLETEHFDSWLQSIMDGRFDYPDLPYSYFLGEYTKNFTGPELDEFNLFMGVYTAFMDGDDLFHVGLANEMSVSRGLDKEMMVGWPGYNSLNEYLAQGVDVRLNQQVTVVEWSSGGVSISTKRGDTYDGSAVIVTVPLGAMQHRTVTFRPDLPSWKWSAFDDIGMALLDKIFLVFDEVWWPNVDAFWKAKPLENNMGKNTASEWYNLCNFEKGTNDGSSMPPILLTTPAGLYAKILETMSDEEVLEVFLEELQSIFSNITVPKPVQFIRTQWWKDQYTFGAFASPGVNSNPLSFDYMAQSLGNVLFFAGEATSSDRFGYVDGGYITGQRAAKEIINSCCHEPFDGASDPLNQKLPKNHREIRQNWSRRVIQNLKMRHPNYVPRVKVE